jgi:arginyl-tRNA synthetase
MGSGPGRALAGRGARGYDRAPMREHVVDIVRSALARGAAAGRWPAVEGSFTVEPPRDPRHGDFAVNAAMVLAKPAGKPPRELAAGLVEVVRAVDAAGELASLEVAGPGFVNVRLATDVWLRVLGRAIAEGPAYGRTAVGKGKRVIVEYVSANPTGPMHVGHGRGAVVGDGVQSLLRWAGFDVVREYYVNDYGAQVQTLARSVHLRYQEHFGRAITMPPKSYPGEYVKEIAGKLAAAHGERFLDAPEAEWLVLFRDSAVAHVLELIRGDLATLDITFDRWSSEKALYESGTVQRFLGELEAKGLVYVGKLPPPKSRKGGAPPPPPRAGAGARRAPLDGAGAETQPPTDGDAHDVEEEGLRPSDDLTLFRSSQFGDEVDRPVKKADGTPTYFCADIAYHWEKRQRADLLVDVFGADHGGYVPRLHAALQGLGYAKTDLHVILLQMVNLTRGGEAVKMSKRAGTVVGMRDVVDEAGRDATRFMFLTRRADSQLDFDLELVKKQTLDNPVFYAQYGHARLAAVFRRAAEQAVAVPEYGLEAVRALTGAAELDLVRRIAAFPDLLAGAAVAYEPHRVAFWLQETNAAFHSWYTQSKRAGEPILGPDPVKTAARLLLCRALQQVVANALAVLGVTAPDRMETPETREAEDAV